MNDVAAILTSIKTAVDLAKILKDSSSSLAEAEQKLKLADLISALAEVKMELAEIQTLLTEKDARIRELSEALKISGNLEYEAPFYWRVEDGQKDGPFCQKCYDADSKLIRLQKWGANAWKCVACGNVFNSDGSSGIKCMVVPRNRGRGTRGIIG